ncbi:MAG: response regulator [Spirochaetales bacterium]|nr:response regulator [Spirochaetales bacterium]
MNALKVLFVDDEENILNSIRRLFFDIDDIVVFTANNAVEGIRSMEKDYYDVLISDERMPNIKGHQFIQFAKDKFPDTVRCILTGYSNPDSILKAINLGDVYRYIVKPWKDEELIHIVRTAGRYGRALRENRQLQEKLKAQNKLLLEKVEQRTAYLKRALESLQTVKNELEQGFHGTANLLNHLIMKFHPRIGQLSRNTANLGRKIGLGMNLDDANLNNIHTAALLHRISTLGEASSEEVNRTDEILRSSELIRNSIKIPELAAIIEGINENFDGSGQPDRKKGDSIPLESRIIRVALDYESLLFLDEIPKESALEKIASVRETLYDIKVLKILSEIENKETGNIEYDVAIPINRLKSGMIILEDINLKNGVLYLPWGTVIDEHIESRLVKSTNLLDVERKIRIGLSA